MNIKAIIKNNWATQYTRSAIQRIGTINVTDRVVHEIYTYIDVNKLVPGQKLPPERYFIEELKVSRSSVREAMRILSTLALVEVRHGDGTYVTAPTTILESSTRAIFDATEENALRNLLETRFGIETAMINAVIQRASEADFDRLEKLLDQQRQELEKNSAYVWEPLEFELALIEITGNNWLYEIELMLRKAWQSLSQGIKADVGRYAEWHLEHRAILASLRSHNAVKAQQLIRAHLDFARFESDLRKIRRNN